jgi:membrane fusion protein (multidrug efflux system)
MAKRMIVMLVVVLAVLTGLGFVKFQQIQTAIAQGAAFQPPPEAVTTIVASTSEWPDTLGAIGTVAAVQGVTVSADLPGTVDRVLFESGRSVAGGSVLVELDTRQEQAQLSAADAERELARLTFQRMKGLLDERVVSQAEYDQATATQKQSEGRAAEIRAAIDRKTIRAPFAGVLGIRQVNRGQYLSAGDPVVTLQSLDPIYVNFGVPQQHVRHVQMGRPVRITADDLAGTEFTGRVTALDSVVDPATRNVQVQATLSNSGGRLRPGMFVQANLLVGTSPSVITLPASAVNYAPFGDSVFILTDGKTANGNAPGNAQNGSAPRTVRQQFVKLGGARGDQVAVLSGVSAGEEVVTSGVFKLRTGAAVLVNNTVQPGNNPAPTPEER